MNILSLVISSVLVLMGSLVMLISAIGLLRLPDFYSRISAVTKNSTIGVVLVMAGAVIYFNNIEVLLKGIGIIFFIALTSPTSAYVISKAAVHVKVPFWLKTNLEDFKTIHEGETDQEKEERYKQQLQAKRNKRKGGQDDFFDPDTDV